MGSFAPLGIEPLELASQLWTIHNVDLILKGSEHNLKITNVQNGSEVSNLTVSFVTYDDSSSPSE